MEYEQLPNGMMKARLAHSIHYSDGDERVLIVGGENNDEVVAECESYDINNQKSEVFGTLLEPRWSAGTMKTSTYFYVFGGKDEDGFLGSIERHSMKWGYNFEQVDIDGQRHLGGFFFTTFNINDNLIYIIGSNEESIFLFN